MTRGMLCGMQRKDYLQWKTYAETKRIAILENVVNPYKCKGQSFVLQQPCIWMQCF